MLIANPLDLPYRVQAVTAGTTTTVFREAADPSLIRFGDRFLLFASMSGGFWHSSDLATWDFVATPTLPTMDYAPDVAIVDGALVVCASRAKENCDFYRSTDPFSGEWERIPGSHPFYDPALFQDEDGRLYLYEGCSPTRPIQGVELDPTTFERKGKPVGLIPPNSKHHGWERPGADWDPRRIERNTIQLFLWGKRPWIEGAWVTKHAGRYHLQYAAPATELNIYSNGSYVSDSPLGPFTYVPSSPFSSKPGGFIDAAGHGSTFQDAHGNWWHIASMRVSEAEAFERRLGVFPAGFDEDGRLFCDQRLADYPIEIPTALVEPRSLSGRLLRIVPDEVSASSEAAGHSASQAASEDIHSWWTPALEDAEPWVELTLPRGAVVSAIQVNTYEQGGALPPSMAETADGPSASGRRTVVSDVPAPFLLEVSTDGNDWDVVRDAFLDGRPHELIELPVPATLAAVRVRTRRSPLGVPLSVSGVRVFGGTEGAAPAAPTARAVRTSPLDAQVSWSPITGADEYVVRYGIAPDRLHSSWQTTATELRIGSLNAGQAYWVAVDAVNSSGIGQGSVVRVEG